VEGWKKLGLEMMSPKATFYCWGRIPEGYVSKDFSFKLLEETNVWMIPGSTYGKNGEGYVRISCAQPSERLAEAIDRVAQFLSK
ncbi:aminotransferase class I/II-fold pyridoxal phosphate-dependent enzyme, partial [Fibrobacterota bacterium]